MERKNSLVLNITSGDCSGKLIGESSIQGEVFVWRDVLYDGPLRNGGVLSADEMQERAKYLSVLTGGGLLQDDIFQGMEESYARLVDLNKYDEIVFWSDACLFDLSMLAHILTCVPFDVREKCRLICISEFDGIAPFNGLGQLTPEQIASLYPRQKVITEEQFEFLELVDLAFSTQGEDEFLKIVNYKDPPLCYFSQAVIRWLEEKPGGVMQVGKLEKLVLDALGAGCVKPSDIFKYVAEHDSIPQYWGDTTLWQKVNGLSDRGLILIEGPDVMLPQWINSGHKLSEFVVKIAF
jgi:hypothetical protein